MSTEPGPSQARLPAHYRLPRPHSISPCDCPGVLGGWHVHDRDGLRVTCVTLLASAVRALEAVLANEATPTDPH